MSDASTEAGLCMCTIGSGGLRLTSNSGERKGAGLQVTSPNHAERRRSQRPFPALACLRDGQDQLSGATGLFG